VDSAEEAGTPSGSSVRGVFGPASTQAPAWPEFGGRGSSSATERRATRSRSRSRARSATALGISRMMVREGDRFCSICWWCCMARCECRMVWAMYVRMPARRSVMSPFAMAKNSTYRTRFTSSGVSNFPPTLPKPWPEIRVSREAGEERGPYRRDSPGRDPGNGRGGRCGRRAGSAGGEGARRRRRSWWIFQLPGEGFSFWNSCRRGLKIFGGTPRGFLGTNWGSDRKEKRWGEGCTGNAERHGKEV